MARLWFSIIKAWIVEGVFGLLTGATALQTLNSGR
jgi:hypothetical protein